MKNLSYKLEKLELIIDVVLKWFVLILLLLGLVATVANLATGQVVVPTYQPLFEDILWSVVAIGLIILWREVREIKRAAEAASKRHPLPK